MYDLIAITRDLFRKHVGYFCKKKASKIIGVVTLKSYLQRNIHNAKVFSLKF